MLLSQICGHLYISFSVKVRYVIIYFSQKNLFPVYHHDYEHVLSALENRQVLRQQNHVHPAALFILPLRHP